MQFRTFYKRWRIVKNYTSFSNADGTYRIMSCLKANYGFVLNGGTIQVWDYAVRDIRRWKFEPGRTLNTPRIGQEMDQWCWAASALMAARTNNSSTRTQSQIVSNVKGSVVNQAATTNETRNAANFASGTTNYYVTSGTLSQNTLISEINAGRPIIILRGWFPDGTNRDGGHFTVIYGYEMDTNRFLISDPWPVDNGALYTRTYAQLLNGAPSGIDTGRWETSIRR